jgi:cytochrome P450
MGECLVALERHPDQRRLVAGTPVLIPNAIEEVLRWHGPTQAIVRLAARDIVLAGTRLKEGDILY